MKRAGGFTGKIIMKNSTGISKIIKFALTVLLILNTTVSFEENWWRLYFTTPYKSTKKIFYNNPERAIIRLFKSSKKTIYAAFYDLSSFSIVTSLISARKRGVDVKLVIENKNYNKTTISLLLKNNIPIQIDGNRGLMHNKFAVVDSVYLWTGSFNLTNNGSKRNNNSAILIYSKILSKIYLDEFKEMFSDNIFGNRFESGPFADLRKKYYVKISSSHINAYFAPEDNVEKIILKRLKKAKESIHFMAFSFTSDKIGEMIIDKHKSGIKIYGIFERMGSGSRYSEYMKMKLEGLNVRLDKNRYKMHHKVIIIDKKRTIMGSYNLSKNANTKNDENILIIDNEEIAKSFLAEFNRLY